MCSDHAYLPPYEVLCSPRGKPHFFFHYEDKRLTVWHMQEADGNDDDEFDLMIDGVILTQEYEVESLCLFCLILSKKLLSTKTRVLACKGKMSTRVKKIPVGSSIRFIYTLWPNTKTSEELPHSTHPTTVGINGKGSPQADLGGQTSESLVDRKHIEIGNRIYDVFCMVEDCIDERCTSQPLR